jgi:hypothetical protein
MRLFFRWIFLITGVLLVTVGCLFVFSRPQDEMTLVIYEEAASPTTGRYGAGQFYVTSVDKSYTRPVTQKGHYVRYIGAVRDERLLILNYSTKSLDIVSLTGRVLKSLPVNTVSFDGLRVMSIPANGKWLVSSYPSLVSRLNLQSGEEEPILLGAVSPGNFNPLGYLSPDGKWLAVLTTATQDNENYDGLVVMSFDGTDLIPLLDHQDIQSTSLHWSPDSQWVAVETTRQPPEIFWVRRDGSKIHSAAFGLVEWLELQGWSLDSRWIYFIGSAMGSHLLVRLEILTGTADTVAQLPPGYCCLQFSPDNRWATYQTLAGVYRVSLETGEVTRLSTLQATVHLWAADKIILGAWQNDDVYLYEMGYDGGQVRGIVRAAGKRHFLTTLLTPEPRHFHVLPMFVAGILFLAAFSRLMFFHMVSVSGPGLR